MDQKQRKDSINYVLTRVCVCVCVNVEMDNTRAIHGRVSRETDDAIITRSTMTVDVCVVLKTRAH